mmetsp:Transcript_344/g.729  ORF Transcript_344/g.729 Transcript_344/m.729 type:complete len:351 (-) Transcript_344:191-1243(-)
MSSDPSKVGEKTFEIRELARQYPPAWQHENKRIVARIAGDDKQTPGSITVSRWKADNHLPLTIVGDQVTSVVPHKGFFSYNHPTPGEEDEDDDSTMHWHMNFADPLVFAHGEGPLLAQDELQIVEHPILCSIGKALQHTTHDDDELRNLTREQGVATPILVQGAPRRCRLLTDRYPIYGDHFAQASKEIMEEAVERIDIPMRSNIVAISAAAPSYGMYTVTQITHLLETAYAGFRACVLTAAGRDVAIHTGHWGCGAYGGNKGLVAAIQIMAAGMAGVRTLHFWYGPAAQDYTALQHGMEVASRLHGTPTLRSVQLLDSAGYSWGVANENHVPYEPPECCLLSRPIHEEE